jgi:hypothetical protein
VHTKVSAQPPHSVADGLVMNLHRHLQTPSAIWEPIADASEPTTSSTLHQQRDFSPPPLPLELEAELLRILTSPLAEDETYLAGYAKREACLLVFFSVLSLQHSAEVVRRLQAAKLEDPLVAGFARLSAERRERLRAFLKAARRRAATQQPGRAR